MTLTVALLVIAEATSGAAAIPLLPESLSEPVPKCQHQGKTVNAPKITERQRAMYMQHLAAANEEPLITLHRKFDDKGGSSVRFLWLRSFDAPIIARVHGLGTSSPHIVAVQLTERGGYELGVPSKVIDRPLKAGDVADLKNALAKSRFLHPPRKAAMLEKCTRTGGLDGAAWILEAVDRNGYHFERDWSPQSGEIRSIGIIMLKLTGLPLDSIY